MQLWLPKRPLAPITDLLVLAQFVAEVVRHFLEWQFFVHAHVCLEELFDVEYVFTVSRDGAYVVPGVEFV